MLGRMILCFCIFFFFIEPLMRASTKYIEDSACNKYSREC